MNHQIRTILVDDHKLFRDGLKFVLSQIENMEVIAEASNGIEFLKLMEEHEADLVLMDISMPRMDGIESTSRAMELNPDFKIIALSMYCEEEYYYKMIQSGAKGFILKESGKEELERAIGEVMDGGSYFSQKLLTNIIMNISVQQGKVYAKKEDVHLTRRELEVLEMICMGLTNQEIADKLFISMRTVEGHKTSLINKTGVKNSISLVLYALKNKLVII